MSFAMFLTSILVGVVAGMLAGMVAMRGGAGLKHDITLGLIGSIGASWVFGSVAMGPDSGVLAIVVVGALGAAVAIAAQRMIWPAERPA